MEKLSFNETTSLITLAVLNIHVHLYYYPLVRNVIGAEPSESEREDLRQDPGKGGRFLNVENIILKETVYGKARD
jgi:hypothetical protein